ncbi:hypothetical protein AB0I28_32320 [Phytomonospora sp. NPDC050363]|uniref:hypothetical protein n=1 Tax=Phytomonospora sp. NPDC050363 TaxID=3155642 RepID=UPI0033C4F9DD
MTTPMWDLHFSEGAWEPTNVIPADSSTVDTDLDKAGWERFWVIGGQENGALHIVTWRRDSPDGPGRQYLLQVWDVNTGSEFVQVDGLPGLMELLAKWAPIVQAASVAGAIAEGLNGALDRYGFFEQIGARLAWGADTNRDAMEREASEERDRRAEWKRQQAAERPAAT